MKAVVVGAGIGGLSAANALARAGLDVAVFEQMRELREVGSGLTLWVNAMRSLRKFDAEDAIRERGAEVRIIENRRWDGREYKHLPIGEVGEKYHTHSVSIHRGHLQRALADLLPDAATLTLGAQLTGFEQDADGVTARFADGREERCDALVGADGISSRVRTQLFGAPQPRYSGYTCWRSAVHLEHPALRPTVYIQLYARGSNFGIFPIGENYWSWYGTKMTPEGGAAGANAADWKREAIEQFDDWYEPVRAAIEKTPESDFVRQDIRDLKPISVWGEGRVTLLGDAAHATTPALGQGGCMAIEDAVVLARELSKADGDVPGALRRYTEQRRDRANGIVTSARRQGYLYHGPNPLVGAVRGVVLRSPVRVAMRVVDNLMGYEA